MISNLGSDPEGEPSLGCSGVTPDGIPMDEKHGLNAFRHCI